MENKAQEDEHIAWLEKLKNKYDNSGLDTNTFLEGLYWAKPINYWDYIEVDTLLSLQKPRTVLPDESVFIMYHQVNELLFKMILHEIGQIASEKDLSAEFFSDRLNRISRYFDVLTSSFSIMKDGMTREQYLKFRTTLTPASGFQSGQYRMIEICSTDLHNLIDARFKEKLPRNSSWEEKVDHLYWQAAGKNYETGKKTPTLRIFEERYRCKFIALAEEFEHKNIWRRFLSLPDAVQKDEALKKAMRHFDRTVNITWVMAHYNSAQHYLEADGEPKEATGGSDWKKYMHPKYQRRIFFPGVWTSDELANWGCDQPE